MPSCSDETKSVDVSVVIPVYKNAASLCELHGRLSAVLQAILLSYEIVFVNDACPEGSHLVLHDLAERDPQVVVIELRANIGQQRAILVGLRAARGSIIVLMDADLQDAPEDIPKLVHLLTDEISVVFGTRYGRYDSFLRMATSRAFKWLLHVLSGVPSGAGLFSAMDTRMKSALLSLTPPCVSVVASMGLTGLPFSSVSVLRLKRKTGVSGYRFLYRVKIGGLTIYSILLHRLGRRFQPQGTAQNRRV